MVQIWHRLLRPRPHAKRPQRQSALRGGETVKGCDALPPTRPRHADASCPVRAEETQPARLVASDHRPARGTLLALDQLLARARPKIEL